MPRPCKRRRVCKEPSCSRFGPRNVKGDEEAIRMTVDEFETIRLIDLEGITQEMCAIQMNVYRNGELYWSTVRSFSHTIYNNVYDIKQQIAELEDKSGFKVIARKDFKIIGKKILK